MDAGGASSSPAPVPPCTVLYAAYAHEKEILLESSESELRAKCESIIQGIQPAAADFLFHTSEDENFQYHYRCHGEAVYICVTSKNTPLSAAYAFLSDMESKEHIDLQPHLIEKNQEHLQQELGNLIAVMQKNVEKATSQTPKPPNKKQTPKYFEDSDDDDEVRKITRGDRKMGEFCWAERKSTAICCVHFCLIAALILVVILVLIPPVE
eukprot:TRINITY_DN33772_c0_g1_i1.p1 TRINITY_DN33772_c0_g1~~TRINITY_DN33772_c0_g1_i1.p1  ORF type:complete len:225 (-),score=5.89 TRINITY_DN33772_c0_g1_i1:56-685(-)